jgi:hypothetical protein
MYNVNKKNWLKGAFGGLILVGVEKYDRVLITVDKPFFTQAVKRFL